jgi:hypothetical protein
MKNYVLTSGNFTTSGNLSGYTRKGERIHVPQRQLEAAGIDKDTVKWPLFVVAGERSFNTLDEKGEPKVDANGDPVTFSRLQAGSVYSTKEAMVQSAVDEASLDIQINSAIKESATKAGLSEKAVEALLTASI